MAQKCIPRFPLEEQPAANMMRTVEQSSAIPYDSIDPNLLALAMGFVPRQTWEAPYDNETALSRGTIFPALDKPFCGWNNCIMPRGAMK